MLCFMLRIFGVEYLLLFQMYTQTFLLKLRFKVIQFSNPTGFLISVMNGISYLKSAYQPPKNYNLK